MTIHKVVTDQDIGDGLRIANGKLEAIAQPGGSGVDLENLPTVAWKKGMGILVKQDGALKQMQPLENIFQEIGVGVTANKLDGLTDEKYHVVVTVTNTGQGTNDQTDLVITKPQLGTYTTTDFRTSQSGGEIARASDDFHYTITNLTKGGTVKVEFDVMPSGTGTYQFTASVNPNSALDQQSNNNSATIILSATAPARVEDTSYIPTVECPAVVVKYQGQPLYMGLDAVNLFGDRTTLQGLTFETENVGTIAVPILRRSPTQSCYTSVRTYNGVDVLVSEDFSKIAVTPKLSWLKSTSASPVENTNGYTTTTDYTTFFSGTITITGDVQSLLIAVRPTGIDCLWQYIMLHAVSTLSNQVTRCDMAISGNSATPVTRDMTNTHLSGGRPMYSLNPLRTNDDDKYAEHMTNLTISDTPLDVYLNRNRINLIGDKRKIRVGKVAGTGVSWHTASVYPLIPNSLRLTGYSGTGITEVNIKAGETITLTGCEVPQVVSQGRLQCTYTDGTLTIVAAADATPADFIRSDNGKLLIKVVV